MRTKSTKARGGRKSPPAKRTQKGRKARTATATSRRAGETAVDRKWAWHYRTLVALRDALMQDSRKKLQDVAAAIEPHSMHLADSATDEFDHDLALTLLAREENALTDVNDAITRILEGTYGVCLATGAKISPERLRALPWCRYARDVEEQLEQSGLVTKTRIPDAVSLRGPEAGLPGTGRLPPEGTEGEAEEPEESEMTKVVDDASTPRTEEIEPPVPAPVPSAPQAKHPGRRTPRG